VTAALADPVQQAGRQSYARGLVGILSANVVDGVHGRPPDTRCPRGLRQRVRRRLPERLSRWLASSDNVFAIPIPRTLPTAAPHVAPSEAQRLDHVANIVAMSAPLGLLAFAAWRAWGGALRWSDLLVLAILYSLTGLGVTVGFHRLFTHRSFKTGPAIRAAFAVLGSAAVEGPVTEWVSTHRKHHRFSDRSGDPHSPHTDHGAGWRGALRGLFHAHVGWMFRGVDRANPERYAKDLLADPAISAINRTFPLWVLVGLAFPFGLGVALTGSLFGGLTGLLWGGAVRILFLHHATFSINSLCHFFGRRRFTTGDQSRNLAWLALPTFGEAWHNNHHAFPTSAHHGLTRWQLDPGGWLIDALQRLGLAWDVVRIAPNTQRNKLATRPS
jgi:stearoyl-CoA desaturase (Delta-9 desaturase)